MDMQWRRGINAESVWWTAGVSFIAKKFKSKIRVKAGPGAGGCPRPAPAPAPAPVAVARGADRAAARPGGRSGSRWSRLVGRPAGGRPDRAQAGRYQLEARAL